MTDQEVSVYSLKNTCRCCLKKLENGIGIDEEYVQESSEVRVFQQLQHLELKISLDDGKPQQICTECFGHVKILSSFRILCLKSQELLDTFFGNTTDPKSPTKSFKSITKTEGSGSQEDDQNDGDIISIFKDEPEIESDNDLGNEDKGIIEEEKFLAENVDEKTKENKEIREKKDNEETSWRWLKSEFPELQATDTTKDPKSSFTCNVCQESFSEELKLLQHVATHPTKVDRPVSKYIICHLCDTEFKGKAQLRLHMRTHHPKERPHACPICRKTFQSISNRNTHVQSHNQNNSFRCSICNQGFKSKVYMNKHKKSVHDITQHDCPHCLAKFTNKVKFEYHLKSHDPNKKYKCRYCEKSFIQHHHLVNHERTHTGERPYLCNHCGKHFKQECNFKLHLRYHTGVRPYVCSQCGKDFVQKSSFAMHMRQHTGEKQWQCEHCGKHFIQKSSLVVHLRTHTGERPFKCDSCDKAFIQAQQLKYHKYTSHDGPAVGKVRDAAVSSQESRPYPYICQLCNKGFKLPSSLSSHLKVHTEVRKHACPQCGNTFKRAEHLRIHINGVHLKQRPYECSLCDKTFAQSGDRNIHMRRHTGEKPHTCTFCNKTFRLLKAMRAHARIHTGEKPYTCDICKEDFMTYTALANHTMKHEDGTLPETKEGKDINQESENHQLNPSSLFV